MHATKYILLLFGLLALYAASIPFASIETGLAKRINGEVAIIGYHSAVQKQQELEKRHGRGNEGRSRARPSRKTKKQKTTKQKKPKTTKKPQTKNQKQTKHKGAKGNAQKKNKKQCKRAGPGSEQDCKKTNNYKVVEAAARKKGKTLQVNEAYLLKFKTNPGLINHARLIIGTVRKDKHGTLDFMASSTELQKDVDNIQGCEALFGADCIHKGRSTWSCEREAHHKQGTYKFLGNADPEFADPQHFIATGKAILERNTKYNVLMNSCQTHVRKVANVAKLKEEQDPNVPT